jgi:hypothetical protein
MRDYNKGKFLLQRPAQILPVTSGKDSKPTAEMEQQQKRILEKVWSTVERTMDELKSTLLEQLKDSGKSIEEHEKTLESVELGDPHSLTLADMCLQGTSGTERHRRADLGVLRQSA